MQSQTRLIVLLFTMLSVGVLQAQTISGTGCVFANFGVDAGLFSGVVEFGAGNRTNASSTNDWFPGMAGGIGIIDTSGSAAIRTLLQTAANPQYEKRQANGVRSRLNLGSQKSMIQIDGVFARDHFG
ncbi:MAG: hypothetical protein ACKOAY_06235, partial [Haliscomenobacter sp.]